MGCRPISHYSLAATLCLLLLLISSPGGARGDALVTGTVFCDQCRDGERTVFDYPLYGAKVAMSCPGADGQTWASREATTNWFGTYGVRYEGNPDLTRCYARVVGGPSGCGSATGPAQGPRLMFQLFDMDMYTVDSLLSQPPEPMGFCQMWSPSPIGRGGNGGGAVPPPSPPVHSPAPPPPPSPPVHSPAPPPPPAVVLRPPPISPFFQDQASACPYKTWTLQQYRCYWKVVQPETTVAMAFGLIAAQRYGTNMTLREGLQGRGDLYRTLLREGTAALLNSYNSQRFFYPALAVVTRVNWALIGPPTQALSIALRFRWANSGAPRYGNATCDFSPCG